MTCGNLGDGWRTADEGNPIVALLEKVGHGDVAAMDIVDPDTAPLPGPGRLAVDEDDGNAQQGQAAQSRAVIVHRCYQHPVHSLLEQKPEVLVLPDRVPVAVAHDQGEAVLTARILSTARDIGEERVAGIEEDIGNDPAAACAQLAGLLVAHEAEIGHGRLDPRTRAR